MDVSGQGNIKTRTENNPRQTGEKIIVKKDVIFCTTGQKNLEGYIAIEF